MELIPEPAMWLLRTVVSRCVENSLYGFLPRELSSQQILSLTRTAKLKNPLCIVLCSIHARTEHGLPPVRVFNLGESRRRPPGRSGLGIQ